VRFLFGGFGFCNSALTDETDQPSILPSCVIPWTLACASISFPPLSQTLRLSTAYGRTASRPHPSSKRRLFCPLILIVGACVFERYTFLPLPYLPNCVYVQRLFVGPTSRSRRCSVDMYPGRAPQEFLFFLPRSGFEMVQGRGYSFRCDALGPDRRFLPFAFPALARSSPKPGNSRRSGFGPKSSVLQLPGGQRTPNVGGAPGLHC